MIKSKHLRKFYIKQFIVNDFNNFVEQWTECTDKNNNVIIGCLIMEQKGKFDLTTTIINLYLIDKKYYYGQVYNLNDILNLYSLYINKCEDKTKPHLAFINPPIAEWIDSKDNWCKKMAANVSHTYNMSFEEALSEVYYTILKCYKKGTIYMGNLVYIRTAIFNNILCKIRDNKNKVNADSGLAVSMNLSIGKDGEDELTLEDVLSLDDMSESSISYNELVNALRKMMSKVFSNRELDQIINNIASPQYIPTSTYNKLLKWRKAHSPLEIYEEIK